MSTIIDELIVTLGLDPSAYKKGSRETDDSLKKTREASRTTTRDMESQNKRASESFSKLKNEAVGLFLTFAGASSIASFVTNIVSGDAATGRLAKNLGIATNELSAWELAVKTVGGSTADADGALNKLSKLYYDFRTGQLDGTSGQLLASLGVFNPEDLAKPTEGLLKLSEAADKFAAEGKLPEFRQRLLQLGIPEATINLLQMGRRRLGELLDEKKRDAAASQQNADESAKLEKALADLEARITSKARPAIYAMVEGLLQLDAKFGLVNIAAPIAVAVVVAVGVAAAGAIGPIGLFAAGVAAIVTAMDSLVRSNPEFQKTLDSWEAPLKNLLPKSWQWIFDRNLGSGGGGSAPAGGGGPAASSGNSGGGGSNADFFRANGFTDAQARGIAAGIHAEGGDDPNARNKSSGAMGIGQWLGPRKARLIAKYGPNPTLAEQRQFLLDELRGGDAGGAFVRGASTDVGTLDAYIGKFMRPAAGAETIGDERRGRAFLGYRGAATPSPRGGAPSPAGGGSGGDSHTTIGTIVVNTASTDANGIARDLRGAIARRTVTAGANQGLE